MRSWYAIRAVASGAEVAIYDEIGAYGVSAKGFLAELGALPDAAPIDLRLNSPGGSVFDAVAIYNALKRHEGNVTVWIDGIAASAASYIAMAGDEIVMPENAFLMIHDPAGLVAGTAGDMRAMAEALEKVKGALVQGYAAKSGRTPEDIAALMTAETWFDARDALDAGLATRIAEPVRMAARFDIARFRNAPPELAEAVEGDETGAETVLDGNGSEDPAADIVGSDDDVTPDADPALRSETEGTDVADGNIPPGDADPETGGAATNAAPNPGTIRAEVLAHARAVVDLCRLAGQPQMAGRFLEADASLDEVRATLLALRSEAEPEIASQHPQPGRPSAARPWGEIVARTFKVKG
jgi:ATP-dependent protease ClpP protease subunit